MHETDVYIMDPEDENDLIEAEIQEQLKSLTSSVDVLAWQDELQTGQNEDMEGIWEYEDEQVQGSDLPDSVQNYLDTVNKRSDELQKDLHECQHLLSDAVQVLGDADFYTQSSQMKEIAFILGEDPEELRDRVLAEVEEEEMKEAEQTVDQLTNHGTDTVTITTDVDYIMSSTTATLEQVARQKLLQLDEKLKQRHLDIQQDIKHQTKQQAMLGEYKDQDRLRKQKQHADELKQVQQDRQIYQVKAEQELELEIKKNQEIFNQHQAKIEEFSKETEEERLEFESYLTTKREKKMTQRHHAATLLQAAFRSYRVRKKYWFRLHRLKEERQQRKLQRRQMEIVALRRAEDQRKKKEKAEKKQMEEEARKKKEVIEKQAEEERKKVEAMEKKKLAQEKKRLELLERQRLQEEQRQHEEELKQARVLEERTQEILSKIAQDKANIIPGVISNKWNGSDAGIHNEATRKTQDVFITAYKNTQRSTPVVKEQNMSNVDNPVETSNPCHKTLHHSCKCDEKEMTRFECKADKQEMMLPCVTEVSQQVQTESTPVKNDKKHEALNSDACAITKQALTQNGSSVNGYESNDTLTAPVHIDTSLTAPVHVDTSLTAPVHVDTSLTAPVHVDTSLTAPVHVDTSLTAPVHVDTSLTAPVHVDTSLLTAPVHVDTSLTAPVHVDTSLTAPVHVDTSLTAPVHVDTSLTAPVHVDTSLTAPVHVDTSLTAPVHVDTSLTAPVHVDTSLTASVHVDTSLTAPVQVDTSLTVHVDTSLTAPVHIEARRLQWLHNSVSHSSLVSNMKCNETRKALKRVRGDNKLPALTSSQLLAASQPQIQLSEVSVVMVEDAAPCSLSSLSSCQHLQCLHVQQSGVILLTGLDHCANISYINLQNNKIEGIHCRDRTRLTQLLLQNNKLTSVHGLEGCTHLRYVQLSNNCITRTGGLQSLVTITHLDMSYNQLVTIDGLGHLIYLQDLNLSHNHLSTVQEIETCCLLQRLNVESNSLVEMPPMQNHVLLHDVNLTDNSLTSISPLSQAWLPLLQYLSLAQNGLSDLPDMEYCLMLKTLDVSHNCITETDVVIARLKVCHYLEELRLEGNPMAQEDNYRYNVLGKLVQLRVLDDQAVEESVWKVPTRSPFSTMCLSQLHSQDKLHTAYQQHITSLHGNSSNNILEASQVKSAYLECSLKQAMQQRYMHESDEVTHKQTSSESVEATFYKYIGAQSASLSGHLIDHIQTASSRHDAVDDHTQTASSRRDAVDDHTLTASSRHDAVDDHTQTASSRHDAVDDHTQTASSRHDAVDDHTQTASSRHDAVDDHTQTASSRHDAVDDHIQTASSRHDAVDDHTQTASSRHDAVDDHTQTASSRHDAVDDHTHTASSRHDAVDDHTHTASSRHDAVDDHIQPTCMSGRHVPVAPLVTSEHPSKNARVFETQPHQYREARPGRWKEYMARQDVDVHTRQCLAAVHIQALWRGFRVRNMLAVARQAVRYHDSDEEEEDTMMYDEVDPTAWDVSQASIDSHWTPSATPIIPMQHPCIPATHIQSHQSQSALQHTPQPPRHVWYESSIPETGYTPRDAHSPISQLVSKPPIPPVHTSPGSDTSRAPKSHRQDQLSEEWGFKDATTAELMMKRAKKLSKGGNKKKPLDPLERYHMMKKVQGSARVAPSPKRGIQRQEFFQAREQEIQNAISVQRKEKEHNEARTFQWVQRHADSSGDMVHESGRHSNSEPNLPVMSLHALQGRVQLTASPSLELQSVDGASSVSSMSHRPRSHSLSSQQGHDEVHFPAIKTNSAPSGRSRERQAAGSKKAMRGLTGTNYNQK